MTTNNGSDGLDIADLKERIGGGLDPHKLGDTIAEGEGGREGGREREGEREKVCVCVRER